MVYTTSTLQHVCVRTFWEEFATVDSVLQPQPRKIRLGWHETKIVHAYLLHGLSFLGARGKLVHWLVADGRHHNCRGGVWPAAMVKTEGRIRGGSQ